MSKQVGSSKTWLYFGIADVLLILILSLISLNTLKKIHLSDLASLDKLAHLSLYGFAAFCFGVYYKINHHILSYPLTKIFITLFVLGFSIEWLQSFTHLGRQFDYLDQLANSLGIIIGCFGSKIYYQVIASKSLI